MLAQEIVDPLPLAARRPSARSPNSRRGFAHGAMPDDDAGGHACRPQARASPIAQLAKQAGIVESTSEALRLIAQRGLKVDGDVVADKG